MSQNPFLRRIELTIGPLKEDQAGSPAQATTLISTGDRNGLRIQFSVEKSKMYFPNPAGISVFNLSPDIKDRIVPYYTKTSLVVGWENVDPLLLYSGAVLSCVSAREGPDIITTMTVMDGFSFMSKDPASKTYSQGTPVSVIVRELAQLMTGVQIGVINVSGTITGVKGRTVFQRPSNELNLLANEYGFSWNIDKGVFTAIDDTQSFSQKFEISARLRNLIYASPILSTPFQEETGVEIQAVLDPRVAPLYQVELISDLNRGATIAQRAIGVLDSSVGSKNRGINGTYVVHHISYLGDTFGNDWTMTIQSFPPLRSGAKTLGGAS